MGMMQVAGAEGDDAWIHQRDPFVANITTTRPSVTGAEVEVVFTAGSLHHDVLNDVPQVLRLSLTPGMAREMAALLTHHADEQDRAVAARRAHRQEEPF